MPNALKTKSLEGVPFPSNHLSVEETYQTTYHFAYTAGRNQFRAPPSPRGTFTQEDGDNSASPDSQVAPPSSPRTRVY